MLPKEAIKFDLSKEEKRICKSLTRQFGTSYFWATLLFPRAAREATFVLYAFFRIPDEFVDNAKSEEEARKNIEKWEAEWESAKRGEEVKSEVLHVAARLFKTRKIPYEFATAFLAAMKQDLTIRTYETYKDLQKYMYGSAAVVGLMMTYVIGAQKEEAEIYAAKLGEAMQLTNFLRDIGEDWETRGRIYMPQEELRQFGITQEMIAQKEMGEKWVEFMKFQIQRARTLYKEAEKGIPMLRKEGRKAVYAALVLYQEILTEIEKNEYDTLSKRARTSTSKKLIKLTKVLCKKW